MLTSPASKAATDDGYMFETHDDPILADETRMWQDNEPVLLVQSWEFLCPAILVPAQIASAAQACRSMPCRTNVPG